MIFCPCAQLPHWKAPVPTAFLAACLLASSCGEMTLTKVQLRARSGLDVPKVSLSVLGSLSSMVLRLANSTPQALGTYSWMVFLTAVASNGVPSWNFTSGRSLNSHWVASALDDQDSASAGSTVS